MCFFSAQIKFAQTFQLFPTPEGGWYIYNDLAFSNGNEFIGGDSSFGDRLGANADNDWITRFNINFGYYF